MNSFLSSFSLCRHQQRTAIFLAIVKVSMQNFRPRAPGADPPMRAPNIRNRTVCRYCVHCNHAVSTNWERCRFEYCGQAIFNGQHVPKPPTPDGWSVCWLQVCLHKRWKALPFPMPVENTGRG
ncbi:unnamed protein product [Allacma fusca]|uniref:Uncharacterized protein n=1 Tax=Allacma fusca TaxID=39272 RepID=A0A8J2PEL1_9HEXA|nr:unnamed protein product [Allacma fusca]